MHLFGFGQGGTLACEAGIALSRRPSTEALALSTIVSVHGPLLSLPSTNTSKVPTVIKYVCRGSGSSAKDISALERAYTRVEATALSGRQGEVGMPRDKKEWEPIMRFWSERMRTRNAWELKKGNGKGSDEIYEITGQNKDKVPIPATTNRANLRADSGSATGTVAASTTSVGENVAPPASASGTSAVIPTSAPLPPASSATPKVKPVSGFKKGFLSKGL